MPPKITEKGKPNKLSGNVAQTFDVNKANLDIAQSRFFKVALDGISLPTTYAKAKDYLPVKNISYTLIGTETMTVGIGVFKDIPIITGLRLPKMSLTLVDDDLDSIEKQFRDWYNKSVPSADGYVGYLSEMVKNLTYTSYNVKGDVSYTYQAEVMLTDDFTMTRDYETNELKSMEVNLIIVGSIDGNISSAQ